MRRCAIRFGRPRYGVVRQGPPAPRAQQTPPLNAGGQPAAASGTAAQNPAQGNDISKYITLPRILLGMGILGSGYFRYALVSGDDPLGMLQVANGALGAFDGLGKGKDKIVVTDLAKKYEQYHTAFIRTTMGPQAASEHGRCVRYVKKLGADLALSPAQITAIEKEAKLLQRAFNEIITERGKIAQELQLAAMADDGDGALKASTEKAVDKKSEKDIETDSKGKDSTSSKELREELSLSKNHAVSVRRELLNLLTKRQLEAELKFVEAVRKELTPEQDKIFKAQIAKRMPGGREMFMNGPILGSSNGFKLQKERVYVLDFPGDISASRVSHLREEITAIMSVVDPTRGDTVLLKLNSGGGTVNGYGLAAAQLARLKAAGIKLVVCVDEVAASGGYMMACLGDTIYASPFAYLGSIGVVMTSPNFAERLKREGIKVDDITAGRYKRTLTPYKEPNAADRRKTQQDLERVHDLFKAHVKQYRPQLNLWEVATGEVWIGPDALQKKLCDWLATSDDVLLDYYMNGADLYSVQFMKAPKPPFGPGADASAMISSFVNILAEKLATSILTGGVAGKAVGLDNGTSEFDMGNLVMGKCGSSEQITRQHMAIDVSKMHETQC